MPLRQEEYYEEEYRIPAHTSFKTVEEKNEQRPKKNKKSKKGKAFLIILIFGMALTMVYRFTSINKLNLEVIKLKSELDEINTLNAQLKLSAEKSINLSEIERYAVEELGMQKLQNYQIEYINLEKKDLLSNQKTLENNNIISKIIFNIIEFFN